MDGVFMRKRMIIFAALLLSAAAISAAALQREQQALSEKLIRLHVVANSDSERDQQVKLLVRDAVLTVTEGLDKDGIQRALPAVQQAAENCLSKLGEEKTVRVTLSHERFPTRLYENFALPAGTYRTLRVTIGVGEGHNWWCVAFPSICMRATVAELEDAAVSAGFTDGEIRLITAESGPYVWKFKTLELLERMKEMLSN